MGYYPHFPRREQWDHICPLECCFPHSSTLQTHILQVDPLQFRFKYECQISGWDGVTDSRHAFPHEKVEKMETENHLQREWRATKGRTKRNEMNNGGGGGVVNTELR